MGRKSKLKEERRQQKTQETVPREHTLSRRDLLSGSLGVLAIVLTVKFGYDFLQPTSFTDAYDNLSERVPWLNSLDSRPYVTKKIATPADIKFLRETQGYIPPEGAFSATIPNDEREIMKGTKSTLYVYGECFDPRYLRIKKDLGIVVENVINNHELLHADHFHHGIGGLSKDLFLNEDGSLNKPLFLHVSEAVSYRNEYDNLAVAARKSGFAGFYRNNLHRIAAPHFISGYALAKDKELRDFIKDKAWFEI